MHTEALLAARSSYWICLQYTHGGEFEESLHSSKDLCPPSTAHKGDGIVCHIPSDEESKTFNIKMKDKTIPIYIIVLRLKAHETSDINIFNS